MIARSMGAVFLIEKLFIQDVDVSLPAEWLVTWILFMYERAWNAAWPPMKKRLGVMIFLNFHSTQHWASEKTWRAHWIFIRVSKFSPLWDGMPRKILQALQHLQPWLGDLQRKRWAMKTSHVGFDYSLWNREMFIWPILRIIYIIWKLKERTRCHEIASFLLRWSRLIVQLIGVNKTMQPFLGS